MPVTRNVIRNSADSLGIVAVLHGTVNIGCKRETPKNMPDTRPIPLTSETSLSAGLIVITIGTQAGTSGNCKVA